MNRRRLLRPLAVLFAVWFLAHVLYITWDGLHDYKGNAGIAIVLGNRVYGDSSLSPVLQGRVDRALRLYREGHVPMIMVSGGVREQDGGVPEGRAMKRYLVRKGVPADRIIEDNKGADTYLTARNFLPVADSLHLSSAIVVSSFYHITRSKYIVRKLGFTNVQGVASESFFWNDCIGLPRDVAGFYYYALFH